MTYKITSVKSNASMVTKDHLKDEVWGNSYYNTDDCVRIEIQEETPAQREAMEHRCDLLAKIKTLEDGILYSIIDGDEEWVANKKAQRLLLKQELKGL